MTEPSSSTSVTSGVGMGADTHIQCRAEVARLQADLAEMTRSYDEVAANLEHTRQIIGELKDKLADAATVLKIEQGWHWKAKRDLEHTRQIVAAPWLIALVQAFSPKEIPLDVDETGGYEESTTRWGPNPIYEAIPAWIREIAKTRLDAADVKT